MPITNYSVTFGRKVAPVQFENAESLVTLTGIVEDGEDFEKEMMDSLALAKKTVLIAVGKLPKVQPDTEVGQKDSEKKAEKEKTVKPEIPDAVPTKEEMKKIMDKTEPAKKADTPDIPDATTVEESMGSDKTEPAKKADTPDIPDAEPVTVEETVEKDGGINLMDFKKFISNTVYDTKLTTDAINKIISEETGGKTTTFELTPAERTLVKSKVEAQING